MACFKSCYSILIGLRSGVWLGYARVFLSYWLLFVWGAIIKLCDESYVKFQITNSYPDIFLYDFLQLFGVNCSFNDCNLCWPRGTNSKPNTSFFHLNIAFFRVCLQSIIPQIIQVVWDRRYSGNTLSLENNSFLCCIFLWENSCLVIFLLWTGNIEFSVWRRNPVCIAVNMTLLTPPSIMYTCLAAICRIPSTSKSRNSAKSLPFLCLAVDWRPGSFKIPFPAIFSVLGLSTTFSEVLCSHFWSEYVSTRQTSVVKSRLFWKPGHVGFHQSNGPPTYTCMSLLFPIQTCSTEEIGLLGQKLYNKTHQNGIFHLAEPHCTVTLGFKCFTLITAVYDNYSKISLVFLTIIFCGRGSYFDFSASIVELYGRLWKVIRKKTEKIYVWPKDKSRDPQGALWPQGYAVILEKKKNHHLSVCLAFCLSVFLSSS